MIDALLCCRPCQEWMTSGGRMRNMVGVPCTRPLVPSPLSSPWQPTSVLSPLTHKWRLLSTSWYHCWRREESMSTGNCLTLSSAFSATHLPSLWELKHHKKTDKEMLKIQPLYIRHQHPNHFPPIPTSQPPSSRFLWRHRLWMGGWQRAMNCHGCFNLG